MIEYQIKLQAHPATIYGKLFSSGSLPILDGRVQTIFVTQGNKIKTRDISHVQLGVMFKCHVCNSSSIEC